MTRAGAEATFSGELALASGKVMRPRQGLGKLPIHLWEADTGNQGTLGEGSPHANGEILSACWVGRAFGLDQITGLTAATFLARGCRRPEPAIGVGRWRYGEWGTAWAYGPKEDANKCHDLSGKIYTVTTGSQDWSLV